MYSFCSIYVDLLFWGGCAVQQTLRVVSRVLDRANAIAPHDFAVSNALGGFTLALLQVRGTISSPGYGRSCGSHVDICSCALCKSGSTVVGSFVCSTCFVNAAGQCWAGVRIRRCKSRISIALKRVELAGERADQCSPERRALMCFSSSSSCHFRCRV